MEGNRDEARRCIDIACSSLRGGNLEKARKFLLKAEKLYPSHQAQKLLSEIDALDEGATPEESEQVPEVKYTQEQMDLVRRVKKCKNFYEMLGVSKDSADSEVRKAYKKLALHLHPDKNHAPGAAEAFKAVGNAVAVLTDPEKRKTYDLFGDRSTSGPGVRHRHSHEHHRQFESEATAEELFSMFFGDGFSSHSGNRRYRNHHHDNNQPSLAFGLILVLVVVSLMSTFLTSDPIYSLQQTSKYPVARKTAGLSIPYYVKHSFDEEYTGSLARLELSVQEEYIIGMKKLCMRERHYREAMMSRAQHFGNKAQFSQAQSLQTPSCDTLYRIGKYNF